MENIVLTPEAITALLASKRERGGHERNIKAFVESGEMYKDLATIYVGKDKDQLYALKNTLTMKAKALDLAGSVSFAKVEDTVVMINTAVLATATSEPTEEEEVADDDN